MVFVGGKEETVNLLSELGGKGEEGGGRLWGGWDGGYGAAWGREAGKGGERVPCRVELREASFMVFMVWQKLLQLTAQSVHSGSLSFLHVVGWT